MAKLLYVQAGANKSVKSHININDIDTETLKALDALELRTSEDAILTNSIAARVRKACLSRHEIAPANALMAALDKRPLLAKVKALFIRKMPCFIGAYTAIRISGKQEKRSFIVDRENPIIKWDSKKGEFIFTSKPDKKIWQKLEKQAMEIENFMAFFTKFTAKEKKEMPVDDILALIGAHSKRREIIQALLTLEKPNKAKTDKRVDKLAEAIAS